MNIDFILREHKLCTVLHTIIQIQSIPYKKERYDNRVIPD